MGGHLRHGRLDPPGTGLLRHIPSSLCPVAAQKRGRKLLA
eukprot:CAMPEP_0175783212 /NCGR_PEP_ID=MMETSP0097-20121207/78187_1 /TAXON_ID=311494 /ORGANISM="Alexandrium monilatum, Strain CCMP3105" /LENGTH=39 /DNA_ID= /DNA_START= /DNA_END= /DNA_ORIENTATION=